MTNITQGSILRVQYEANYILFVLTWKKIHFYCIFSPPEQLACSVALTRITSNKAEHASYTYCCRTLPADPLPAAYSPYTFPTHMTDRSALDEPWLPGSPGASSRKSGICSNHFLTPGRLEAPRKETQRFSWVFHCRFMIHCAASPLLKWSSWMEIHDVEGY